MLRPHRTTPHPTPRDAARAGPQGQVGGFQCICGGQNRFSWGREIREAQIADLAKHSLENKRLVAWPRNGLD